MKQPLTIGIVGGMSPESTMTYYRLIIRKHETEFHDHSYPRIIISSVSFQRYIDWQHKGDWASIAEALEKEFIAIAAAGADFAVLATNTMHKVLPAIKSSIPVLSIFEVIESFARLHGVKSVGLTGTRFTMADGFYAKELDDRGLRVLIPDEAAQELIHTIIYNELISGKILPSSIGQFEEVARSMLARGADAVLLACTELELLTRGQGNQIRFIDTTKLHAEAAWKAAINWKENNEIVHPVKSSF
jgi:aspartate racemase